MTDQNNLVSIPQHATAILAKATPLIFLFGSEFFSGFTRTYLISKISIDALESLTIADNITSIILYSIPELMSQDAVFISEIYGKIRPLVNANHSLSTVDQKSQLERLEKEVGSLIRQGWLLSSLVSVPSLALLLLCNAPLVDLFNASEETSNQAKHYILIFAFSIPLEFINRINERFLSAVDKENWLFPYQFLGMCTEIGLSFLLIPKLSAAGAAYARLGKSIISLSALLLLFAKHPILKKFDIFKWGIGQSESMKKIMVQGWPVLLAQLAVSCSAYSVTGFIGRLGKGRLAVEQVVGQYSGFMLSINFAINESANRITAQYYGAQNYAEMRRAGNTSFVLNGIVLVIGAIVINCIPLQFASLFLNAQDLNEYSTMLKYMFIMVSFYNIANVLMENSKKLLASAQDTFFGATLSVVATVALILPLSAISAYLTHFDIYGIAGAMTIGKLIGASSTCAYWQYRSSNMIATNNKASPTSNMVFSTHCYTLFSFCNRKNNAHYKKLREPNIEEKEEMEMELN